MKSCNHCEKIRRDQQALIDAHPSDRYPGMYAAKREDAMTRALMDARWTGGTDGEMAECPCDCHTPARIAGRLPKLSAA